MANILISYRRQEGTGRVAGEAQSLPNSDKDCIYRAYDTRLAEIEAQLRLRGN